MSDQLLENLDGEHRKLLRDCGRMAGERGESAYLVGGSVRDLLLARHHDDLDIVVEGDGMAVAQELARHVGGELTRHHAFQTATVTTPGGLRVDVATARREEYPRPGQLPQVVPGDLREDLERRDFTINTMAICLGDAEWGRFVDLLGGLADLRAGVIRVMHSRSFADDPTRVLRALRFALRFGYEIEEDTHAWLREAVAGGYLAEVSGDRVRKEIRLSCTETPVDGPLRLHVEGVLNEVHPGLAADARALESLQRALERFAGSSAVPATDGSAVAGPGGETTSCGVEVAAPDELPKSLHWVLGLACCAAGLPPQGRWELARRLRLSREERAPLIDCGAPWRKARSLISPVEGARNSDVERALRPLSTGGLLVVAASGATGEEAAAVWRYLEELRGLRPRLGGADLIEMGVPEGPLVGALLERLRVGRLDGAVKTAADEGRAVRAWLAENPL